MKLLTHLILALILFKTDITHAQESKSNSLDSISRKVTYWWDTNGDSALKYLKEGKALALKLGDQDRVANFNFDLGGLYFKMNDFDMAARYILQAGKYYDSLGDKDVRAKVNSALSSCLFMAGDIEGSKRYLWVALDHARNATDTIFIQECHCNMGIMLLEQKRYDSSLRYFREAVRWTGTDSTFYYRGLAHEGRVLELLGQPGAAVEPLKNAIGFARRARHMEMLYNMYNYLGTSLAGLGLYTEALSAIDSGIAIRERNFFGEVDQKQLLQKARILKGKGDDPEAFSAYEEYIRIGDSLNIVKARQVSKNLAVRYDTDLKEKEIRVLSKEKEIKDEKLRQQKILALSILLISGLILASVFMFYRFRIKAVKAEAERANLEMKLYSLRSQINPHFVQNTFNLISLQLMTETDKRQTATYVRQLSGYYRKVLDVTSRSTHSLEDELEFTESYLQLQQHMVPGGLRYEIKVDNDLDITSISVPTMLLQPFVENSIKHGFIKQDADNLIQIEVGHNGSGPVVRITDNGAGLRPGEPVREGFGTRLMRQRLDIQGSGPGERISIRNLEGKQGTLVEIRLQTDNEPQG